jgi:hypothetical protein
MSIETSFSVTESNKPLIPVGKTLYVFFDETVILSLKNKYDYPVVLEIRKTQGCPIQDFYFEKNGEHIFTFDFLGDQGETTVFSWRLKDTSEWNRTTFIQQ